MTEKTVKLKVKSVQNTGVEEEESEITELLTDAVLSVSDGRISLGYDEIVSDDGDVCSTSLVFDKAKPGTVFLSRKGDVTMNCVIEEKTRYRFSYDLGFASMDLVCVGHEVKNSISTSGGEMLLRYDIETRGVPVQSCVLLITVI